jgi:predicted nucleic acid-binding Zn ribbon protein
VLQKISDPRLTKCPECGRDTYEKQVTAAGFRLKGSGWYETDFRGGGPHTTPSKNSTSASGSTAQSGGASGGTSSAATPG